MSCKICYKDKCCCHIKVITKAAFRGNKGDAGKNGTPVFTVKDNTTTVTNVREIRFTDANAKITDLGAGIVQVNFTPPTTVWNDVQNLSWYVGIDPTQPAFRPQYTVEGNKITFRGLLYMPLQQPGGGAGVNVSGQNSYLNVASAELNEAKVSIITNANNNNGSRQGRFMTTDVLASKNLPTNAIPQVRDITFNNVPAFRRYTSDNVAIYRSVVTLKIGSLATLFANGANIGSGCIMVLSPFQDQYDGAGTTPLGNDPLALMVSKVTVGQTAADYVTATDNNPFTVPAAGGSNPFTTNAHKIQDLGGYIINLEGLSGYLN